MQIVSKNGLRRRIDAARGLKKTDLVLKGGTLVNVLSGEIYKADVAITDGRITGTGRHPARKTIDVSSKFILPGFIDSHVHVESSLLTPAEFARVAAAHGTTAIVADPHEIANVLGTKGIRYMLDATEGAALDFYFMLPSCVPASSLETSGARLTARDLLPFLKHERVLGLAEVMDYPGVLSGRPDVLLKLGAFAGSRIDGHAPGLGGKDLAAYIGAGISSDHESSSAAEAREKVRLGMTVFIRESSASKDLAAILPAVTASNAGAFCFATDDLEPQDLAKGGIDRILRKAVRLGLDPVTAVRMATINAARHYGLRDTGAVAPGCRADIVVIDDLRNFTIEKVFKNGKLVARNGRSLFPAGGRPPRAVTGTVAVKPVSIRDIRLRAGTGHARVIELIPDRIETRQLVLPVIVDGGMVANDRDRDIAKLVVVERHRASGRIGVGLVKGFGMKAGAFASTVAHDSHNIIAAGMYDQDIVAAVNAVRRMRGGMVVVKKEKVTASLALPVAGLLSDRAGEYVAKQAEQLTNAARQLGVNVRSPFATLSFLALPVVPELKLTDRGLVDVKAGRHVDLFV